MTDFNMNIDTEIAFREVKIENLTAELERVTENREYWMNRVDEYQRMIDTFEWWLKDQSGDFDDEVLQEAASIFDISLEKTYKFTVTAVFTGTVKAPYSYDMDCFNQDIYAELTLPSDVTKDYDMDCTIEDVDWSEN